MESFKLILRNTECGSKIFGNCEVCDKSIVEIYCLTIHRKILSGGWNVKSATYGCYRCLINITEKYNNKELIIKQL